MLKLNSMKKVIKKTNEKYVTEKTFENSMANIAKSFARVEESLKNQNLVSEMMLKELKALHEDNKSIRGTLSGFVGDVSSHDRRIENLTIRVEKLESKI